MPIHGLRKEGSGGRDKGLSFIVEELTCTTVDVTLRRTLELAMEAITLLSSPFVSSKVPQDLQGTRFIIRVTVIKFICLVLEHFITAHMLAIIKKVGLSSKVT